MTVTLSLAGCCVFLYITTRCNAKETTLGEGLVTFLTYVKRNYMSGSGVPSLTPKPTGHEREQLEASVPGCIDRQRTIM